MKFLTCCLIFLAGCKSGSFFASPNEVHKMKVVLLLRDQTKLNGELSISLENSANSQFEYKPYIQFIPEGKNVEEKINLNLIAGYTLDSSFYALKQLDVYLNDTKLELFVKRLTPEDSRIQLYELYETGRGNYTGETKYSYFLSLPHFAPLETINSRGGHLVPMFDQKMSEIVSDCPALAAKIRSKQPDYFIPMATLNAKKHPTVLMRIINEYNLCP